MSNAEIYNLPLLTRGHYYVCYDGKVTVNADASDGKYIVNVVIVDEKCRGEGLCKRFVKDLIVECEEADVQLLFAAVISFELENILTALGCILSDPLLGTWCHVRK